jgi:hypothetical protein
MPEVQSPAFGNAGQRSSVGMDSEHLDALAVARPRFEHTTVGQTPAMDQTIRSGSEEFLTIVRDSDRMEFHLRALIREYRLSARQVDRTHLIP